MGIERKHAAKGGITAGVVGGLAIAAFMFATNLVMHQDFWVAFKLPAMPFIGERALEPGFAAGPLLIGFIVHMLISAAWGIIFGEIFYGFRPASTIALGVPFGLAVWVIMFYVVMPLAGMGRISRTAAIGPAIVEHVIFGVSVSLAYLPFQRLKTSTPKLGHQVPAT